MLGKQLTQQAHDVKTSSNPAGIVITIVLSPEDVNDNH